MPNLTVVIPTLDEERTLEACLLAVGRRPDLKVVVSDGGSTDDTLRLAAAGGAAVISGPPGRGGQLNRGAAATDAGRLLFVHADCRLPPGWFEAVMESLDDEATALACFRLRTEPSIARAHSSIRSAWLRTLDLGSRGMRLPYGDQGHAVRREVFDRVGGYPDIPLMEDLEFARTCRGVGRIHRLRLEMLTTSRRTERFPIRARLMMLVFPTLFRVGVSPSVLARWYGKAR